MNLESIHASSRKFESAVYVEGSVKLSPGNEFQGVCAWSISLHQPRSLFKIVDAFICD